MASLTASVALAGVARAYLDTAPVIYLIENDRSYGQRVAELMIAAASHQVRFTVSPITLAECLAGAPDQGVRDRFIGYLTQTRAIDFREVNQDDAILAADLRRKSKLALPDCLQLAAALNAGCELFVTNDIDLAKASVQIRLLRIDDLDES